MPTTINLSKNRINGTDLPTICPRFDLRQLLVGRYSSNTVMSNSRAPHVSQLSIELPGVKHYITGHNEEGKAIVASEREAQWKAFDDKTMAFNQVYTTNFPAQLADQTDINAHDNLMKAGTLGLVKKNGVVCRMVRHCPPATSRRHVPVHCCSSPAPLTSGADIRSTSRLNTNA